MAYNGDRYADLLASKRAAGDATLAAMQRQQQQDLMGSSGDWYGSAGQGASMGSMFGPKGAAIGGVLGGGLGLIRGISGRTQAGEGFGDALMNTLLSAPTERSMGQLMQAAPMAMQGYQNYQLGQRNLQPMERRGATRTQGLFPAGTGYGV